ncbi:MAG: hypothetical protein JRI23_21125 [Deltaproteobacteria bacterium]|nr:hypothetical protein [Deltaproteobacteria bacterium]MBW2534437.1 hypothetical protein [Deltaproteobacteria bacterium]
MVDGEGYQLVCEKSLVEQVGGLSVDFHDFGYSSGFTIRSGDAPTGGGCGPGCC